MSARPCSDCFFRAHDLCALTPPTTCATYRPARREGLVPPPQARLVEPTLAGAIAPAAPAALVARAS